MSTEEILEQRGAQYGKFTTHALITQRIKGYLVAGCSWENMTAGQKEALDMIAHKLGRIVNGNPNHADSWDDIAGYAILGRDCPIGGTHDDCA
jgi:hypothetical protein